ncbi:uncharacterized protein [Lepisosteus oculatus]|uniref:uncharacterized protein n=1 Tax=Lepisosteus oculatus TaxID=7918 RepID=UPI0035F521D0
MKLLFVICAVLGPGPLSGRAEVRAVSPGDTVILGCDVTRMETMWFAQRAWCTPVLVLKLVLSSSNQEKHNKVYRREGLESRFTAIPNNSSLRIENVTEEDLALYYCVDRVEGQINIGNGTRLVFPGSAPEGGSSNRTGVTPIACDRSGLVPLSWGLLAGAVPLSALISSGCTFYCLSHRADRRDRSSDEGSRQRRSVRRASQESQEEEEGLHYSTIVPTGSSRRKGERCSAPGTTYAEIQTF